MDQQSEQSSVAAHFAGRQPVVRQLYDQLLRALQPVGPFSEEPRPTAIHLVRGTAFASLATHEDHLVLTLKSDHPLTHARVHKSDQVSAQRYYHYVRLSMPIEVDEELIGWLAEAYALSA